MRSGVEQVLSLEIDLCTAAMLGQPLGKIEIGRASGKLAEIFLQFCFKSGIASRCMIGLGEFKQGRHQGLGHVHTAVRAKVSAGIRQRGGFDFESWSGSLHILLYGCGLGALSSWQGSFEGNGILWRVDANGTLMGQADMDAIAMLERT